MKKILILSILGLSTISFVGCNDNKQTENIHKELSDTSKKDIKNKALEKQAPSGLIQQIDSKESKEDASFIPSS